MLDYCVFWEFLFRFSDGYGDNILKAHLFISDLSKFDKFDTRQRLRTKSHQSSSPKWPRMVNRSCSSGSRPGRGKRRRGERFGAHSAHQYFTPPCGHGRHSAQNRSSLPCGQPTQATQLSLRFPWGHGLHVAQLSFRFPCEHRFPMSRSPLDHRPYSRPRTSVARRAKRRGFCSFQKPISQPRRCDAA